MDAQRQLLVLACNDRGLVKAENKVELKNLSKSDLRNLLLAHSDYQNQPSRKQLLESLDSAIETAAVNWIKRRGDAHGYDLVSVEATGYRWNALPEKSRNAGFSSMDYEGVLTIDNPELFAKMLVSGLGPSKAFGCGLMLIKRI